MTTGVNFAVARTFPQKGSIARELLEALSLLGISRYSRNIKVLHFDKTVKPVEGKREWLHCYYLIFDGLDFEIKRSKKFREFEVH